MSFWDGVKDMLPRRPHYLPKDYPDLTGKNVLVTGTSAGLGRETARLLLESNATVVSFNRSKGKTEETFAELKAEIVKEKPELKGKLDDRFISIYADLNDLTTIKSAVDEIYEKVDKIDIAIYNAGIMSPPKGTLSTQGYDQQFGVNVLGHHLLNKLITPLILKSKSETHIPRTVYLASHLHITSPPGGVDFERGIKSPEFKPLEGYGQSKAANMYQAYINGKQNPDIISVSVHPGVLASDIGRNMSWIARKTLPHLLHSSVYGSYTELWCALNPEITLKDSGKYAGPWGEFRSVRPDIQEGFTNGTAQKVWDLAETEIAPYTK